MEFHKVDADMSHDKDFLSRLDQFLNPVPGYDGPGEISPFAEFLAPIGEVVIAFSRLERWLTWATESALKIRPVDADAIQETIISVKTRIDLFFTVAAPHAASSTELSQELNSIVDRLREANNNRNNILHGAWGSIKASIGADGALEEVEAVKTKYARLGPKPQELKQRSHSVQDMREQAQLMLVLCKDIQRWTLSVFPHAENRVP